MTDEQIIIEVAKMDGWELRETKFIFPDEPAWQKYYGEKVWVTKRDNARGDGYCSVYNFPNYLTSRDAIIPVIEKVITNPEIEKTFNYTLYDILEKEQVPDNHAFTYVMSVFATPRQLCIALLKATGKWVE